jgi:hypothetical protein
MTAGDGRKTPSIRLQIYKHSDYERPNEKWLCGNHRSGQTCPLGPDNKGRCRASYQCIPTKKGDRWVCKRPQARGGRCEPGPGPNGECCQAIQPCVPQRSQRSKRGALGLATVVLILGLLSLILPGAARDAFISPGELSMQHGALSDRCTECHSAARESAVLWLKVAMHPADGVKESKLCLNCHNLGKQPLQAHGLATEQLQAQTKAIRQRIAQRQTQPDKTAAGPSALSALKSLGFAVPQTGSGKLSCASCHQEHRGRHTGLKHMGNRQCQSCHTRTFSSLVDGHPPFDRFGYKRRARLKFDHVSHFKKHFPKEKAQLHCMSCHMTDLAGKTMLTRDFTQACGNRCHLKEIQGEGRAGEQGVAVLNLPGLDLETLDQAGIRIGQWPQYAEGELSPFMRLLLSADRDAASALRTLKQAGLTDLTDLQDAGEKELRAVGTLAWSIKDLFMRLELRGQQEIKTRLESVLGRKLKLDALGPLAALLSPHVVADARKRWLPDLLAEMAARQENSGKAPVQAVLPAELSEEVETLITDTGADRDNAVAAGGWYIPQYEFAVRYRPSGHADSFFRGWLQLLSGLNPESLPEAGQQVFQTLSDPKAPGLCIKCHSIDEQKDHTLRINWRTKRPSPYQHTITRFNHTTHLSLLDDKGCKACHELDKKADFMGSFKSHDASSFVSGFQPIKKDTCMKCHNKAMASDSCLNCHNYHVGTFDPTPLVNKNAKTSE